MRIKRGYLIGGGTLGMLFGTLLAQTGHSVAPGSKPIPAPIVGQVLASQSTVDDQIKAATVANKKAKASAKVSGKTTSKQSAASPAITSPATLIWEQNFSKMTSLNSTFWNIATPSLPIYNNEQQKYANQSENVRIENGVLVLEARKQANGYTSGRVDTKGRQNIEVGSRVEARMKLPKGKGTWPAFWMLSANQPYTSGFNPTDADWQKPRYYLWDGEIDILEAYGSLPGVVEATTHTFAKTRSGAKMLGSSSSSFHTYWMEWRADKLTFGVDNTVLHTHTKSSDGASDWPFTPENKYYIILNLAMGGSGGGPIVQSAGDNWRLEVASVKYFKLNN